MKRLNNTPPMAANALETIQQKVEKAAALFTALLMDEQNALSKLKRGDASVLKELERTFRAQSRVWAILQKGFFIRKDPLTEALVELDMMEIQGTVIGREEVAELRSLLELVLSSRDQMIANAAQKLAFLAENKDALAPAQLGAQLEELGKKAPLQPRVLQLLIVHIKALAEARRQATVDTLTGALNPRGYDQRLKEELAKVARAQREGKKYPLSLVYIDINYFKQINDTYGHAAGDKALTTLATEVRKRIRTEDLFIRKGGDEFIILLPGQDCKVAENLMYRLRNDLTQIPIPADGGKTFSLDISYACALYQPGEPFEKTEERADSSMYIRKRKYKESGVWKLSNG